VAALARQQDAGVTKLGAFGRQQDAGLIDDCRYAEARMSNTVLQRGDNENVSLVNSGRIRSLPSDGNMRHRPRTDRTGQTGKMMSHARSSAALRKIASFSVRDERENAKTGGVLAGNFKA